MESYRFAVIIEQDEDGMYVATVPELRGYHTQVKTRDLIMKRAGEAIAVYLGLSIKRLTDLAKTMERKRVQKRLGG